MRIRGDNLPVSQLEGSDFQKCTDEQMLWLKACRDKIVAGEEIVFDPFYKRNPLLTKEVVAMVLQVIVDKIDHEIKVYGRSHHARWQGVDAAYLRTPKYLDLPPAQQRALVQGMDRIAMKYRMTDEEIEAERIAEEEQKAESQRKTEAYQAERAANLARDPHYYDYEYDADQYG